MNRKCARLSTPFRDVTVLLSAGHHSCGTVDPCHELTRIDRMKPQSIGTEVLQHLLLIQNGTIRAHQHVVVRVEFLKCGVVLACEGSIEHAAMDLQNLIFSHSVSSRSIEERAEQRGPLLLEVGVLLESEL